MQTHLEGGGSELVLQAQIIQRMSLQKPPLEKQKFFFGNMCFDVSDGFTAGMLLFQMGVDAPFRFPIFDVGRVGLIEAECTSSVSGILRPMGVFA